MSDQSECGDFAEYRAKEFVAKFQRIIGFTLEEQAKERLHNSLRSLVAFAWEKGAAEAHDHYYSGKSGWL